VVAPVSAPAPAPHPSDHPAPLRETEHQAIVRAVAECGGNVSKAARQLGISRGRVYRHLQADASPQAEPHAPS
jgi:transcriptional regulator of acetoin/glycerol metabolism